MLSARLGDVSDMRSTLSHLCSSPGLRSVNANAALSRHVEDSCHENFLSHEVETGHAWGYILVIEGTVHDFPDIVANVIHAVPLRMDSNSQCTG